MPSATSTPGIGFAGRAQIGEHVTHDIGETRECFNRGGREPGQ